MFIFKWNRSKYNRFVDLNQITLIIWAEMNCANCTSTDQSANSQEIVNKLPTLVERCENCCKCVGTIIFLS